MHSTPWKIIGRGYNGWHAATKHTSSSGGSLEGHRYWTGAWVAGYLAEAEDGCLVYDASPTEHDDDARAAFVRLILHGGMVDFDLPDDATPVPLDAGTRDAAIRMAPLMGGAARALLTLAASNNYQGFSDISRAQRRRELEAIPGIRIGTVRDGRVEWADGTVTDSTIPTEGETPQ